MSNLISPAKSSWRINHVFICCIYMKKLTIHQNTAATISENYDFCPPTET